MLGQLPQNTIKDLADIARANVPGMQLLQENMEKVVAQETLTQE